MVLVRNDREEAIWGNILAKADLSLVRAMGGVRFIQETESVIWYKSVGSSGFIDLVKSVRMIGMFWSIIWQYFKGHVAEETPILGLEETYGSRGRTGKFKFWPWFPMGVRIERFPRAGWACPPYSYGLYSFSTSTVGQSMTSSSVGNDPNRTMESAVGQVGCI